MQYQAGFELSTTREVENKLELDSSKPFEITCTPKSGKSTAKASELSAGRHVMTVLGPATIQLIRKDAKVNVSGQ